MIEETGQQRKQDDSNDGVNRMTQNQWDNRELTG